MTSPDKRRKLPRWAKVPIALLLVVAIIALAIWLRHGGGETFPNRTGPPTMGADDLELVAALPRPPGNVAVSRDGRVFFTFHPDGKPEIKVAEWVDGEARAYPDMAFQSERDELWFDAPLSLRIDANNHLWVLDQANHGSGDAKLVAIDLATDQVIREHHFTSDQAGLGSHLNDFQVHPSGDRVYIAEASIFGKTPALLVFDRGDGSVRRLLEGHVSVMPEPYYITVDGEPIEPLGLFAVRPGVDSIALDRKGEWLYYAAVTATKMYRIPTAVLDDPALSADRVAAAVEVYADKTESDGITSDDAGTLYLSDPEHNAIVALRPDRSLETLFVDPRLRWPDGFGFGPDGWLYVTCSALQHVIMKGEDSIEANAPYHIFRFRPGATAAPGH